MGYAPPPPGPGPPPAGPGPVGGYPAPPPGPPGGPHPPGGNYPPDHVSDHPQEGESTEGAWYRAWLASLADGLIANVDDRSCNARRGFHRAFQD